MCVLKEAFWQPFRIQVSTSILHATARIASTPNHHRRNGSGVMRASHSIGASQHEHGPAHAGLRPHEDAAAAGQEDCPDHALERRCSLPPQGVDCGGELHADFGQVAVFGGDAYSSRALSGTAPRAAAKRRGYGRRVLALLPAGTKHHRPDRLLKAGAGVRDDQCNPDGPRAFSTVETRSRTRHLRDPDVDAEHLAASVTVTPVGITAA